MSEILSDFFEYAPDAIVVVNEQGKITRVNGQAEALFGYLREEMVGRPVEMLMPGRYRRNHVNHRIHYMDEPRLRPMGADLELFGCCKDGSEVAINIMLNTIAAAGQNLVIAVIRDISEQKEFEEALRESDFQLRASLREKEVMLKEIHHRVKNNLQVISSLLKLQAGHVEGRQMQNVLQESRNRVRTMALAHEILYQSKDLASINFGQYLQLLTSHLRKVYANTLSEVTFELDIEPFGMDLDTAVSCGLVINELVSNALKYAFPPEVGQSGVIKITVYKDGSNQILLEIQDNGIGFPPGLDFENTETLGLQLVNTLVVDELDGAIELVREKGTLFVITLPRPRFLLSQSRPA